MTQVIHLPEDHEDAYDEAEVAGEGMGLARLLVFAVPASMGVWAGIAFAVARFVG